MIGLLITHIALGFSLLLAFVIRYVLVLTKKIAPRMGRRIIGVLATALVTSGVALVYVTKSPLSGACISSLAIILTVVALEFGLQYFVKRAPVDR